MSKKLLARFENVGCVLALLNLLLLLNGQSNLVKAIGLINVLFHTTFIMIIDEVINERQN